MHRDHSKPPYMFQSKAVDYFFAWRWWVAPVVFMPVSATSVALAFRFSDIKVVQSIGAIVGGILLWTLFEYCMHRVMFHFEGNGPLTRHLHYVVHGMHHAHPTDPKRVIFPPFGSLFIGLLMAAVLYMVLPLAWFFCVFAGFICGYCWYEFMHYAAHHVKWQIPVMRRLKRHHLLHHHNRDGVQNNFGVTTSLWDHVFGTFLAK